MVGPYVDLATGGQGHPALPSGMRARAVEQQIGQGVAAGLGAVVDNPAVLLDVPGAVWDAMTAEVASLWSQGLYGEALGLASAEVASLLIPSTYAAKIKFLRKLDDKHLKDLVDRKVITPDEAAQAKAAKQNPSKAPDGDGDDGVVIHPRPKMLRFDSKTMSREDLERFLSDLDEGEGATWVYDKRDGRFILHRSSENPLPGEVNLRGGHGDVAFRSYGDQVGSPFDGPGQASVLDLRGGANAPLVGGSLERLPNGSIRLDFQSGTLQGGWAPFATQDAMVASLDNVLPMNVAREAGATLATGAFTPNQLAHAVASIPNGLTPAQLSAAFEALAPPPLK
jgi:hypothetical protein